MTKVLIVEDEVVLSTLLKAQLEKLDYEVTAIASSGEQAIALATDSRPDLVLMDIMMPGKYNGIQAAEIIIQESNIPIIFLTARSDEEAINEAKTVKPYGYLVKPVKIFDIKAAIEIALSRKDLENRLFESESRYRAVVEDQTELVCRFTPDKKLTFANKAFCQHFGFNKDTLVGSIFGYATADEELPKNPNNPVITKERHIVIDEQTSHWYQWTDHAIFDESGNLTEYQSVGSDITSRKLAEEELKKHRNHLQELVDEQTKDLRIAKEEAEEANRSKSEFLANMSHELRTPMHGILSFAQLGITKIDSLSKEKIQSYFSKIEISGNRLLSLLNNLLDLSQMEAGKTSYLMSQSVLLLILNQVVINLQEQLNEKKQTIQITEPNIPTKIKCDSIRIEQVIQNLLSNAIKFSPEEKNIFISFESAEIVHNGKNIPSLKLIIRDQGVGIPEKELSTVFSKFIQSSRTKTGAGGIGLGLAICHEIVKSHHGIIEAENYLAGGAVFSVTLPLSQDHF
ncbi:MAG: response regulator [Proteobacteria bacterium]|nr:response regulator [Pseudomonadota bacterium]